MWSILLEIKIPDTKPVSTINWSKYWYYISNPITKSVYSEALLSLKDKNKVFMDFILQLLSILNNLYHNYWHVQQIFTQ